MRWLDPLFSSEAIEAVLADTARLQRMLDFEAALARAQVRAGVIPASAAPAIVAKCRAQLFDLQKLAHATALAGNPAIPMVKQLTALVAQDDPEAARFVHWGATSQDANDTGLILQLRDALALIQSDLARLADALAPLAEQHRSTPIVARTLMQQALPTTLGVKVAGWLDAVNRHRSRFAELRPRVLVLQFGGAVGTLAALGDRGLQVSEALADELDLALPDLPWHTQRDRLVELAATLGLLVGTLGKIARDISLHMQTEVSELSEPAGEGRGGSSTMPHKRNPISSAAVLAAATRLPGLVSTMLAAMVQEQERGLGDWHAEWETLPEIVRLAAGALARTLETVRGLEVDPAQMLRNLDATHGLIFAEAVSMALARTMGKSEAHQLVEQAAGQARAQRRHLRDVLAGIPAVTVVLQPGDLARLFDPTQYTGMAPRLVDRALAANQRMNANLNMPAPSVVSFPTHYVLTGPTGAPVLVFSNSLGTNLGMWYPQLPALEKSFRILRYDTRGHGRSLDTPGPYTIEQLARDVLGLLDHLHLDRVSFCGLSMGGMIGMWLGVHAPQRLRKLVLSNTGARIGAAELWNARIDAVRQGGMSSLVSATLERWFSPQFRARSPHDVARVREMLETTSANGYAACCAAIRDADLRDAIAAIRLPTLIVAGAHDPATPAADGKFLAARIPGAHYVELDAAHLSNIEQPDRYTSELTRFLSA